MRICANDVVIRVFLGVHAESLADAVRLARPALSPLEPVEWAAQLGRWYYDVHVLLVRKMRTGAPARDVLRDELNQVVLSLKMAEDHVAISDRNGVLLGDYGTRGHLSAPLIFPECRSWSLAGAVGADPWVVEPRISPYS